MDSSELQEGSPPSTDHLLQATEPEHNGDSDLQGEQREGQHPQLQRKTTNPFRLRQLAREATKSKEPEQLQVTEGHESHETAQQPPTKAVFEDLQTAHLSITAGKARAYTTLAPWTIADSASSGPSETSKCQTRQDPQSPSEPTPLAADANFEEIYLGPPPQGVPNEQFDIEEQAAPKSRPSTFSQVWNAVSRRASSVYRSNPVSSPALPSITNDNSQDEHRMNRLPLNLDLPNPQFSSSPAPDLHPFFGANRIDGKCSPVTSQQEGSTVGEIYRHYEATPEASNGKLNNSVKDSGNGTTGTSEVATQDGRQSEQISYGDSQVLLAIQEDGHHSEHDLPPPPTIGIEQGHSENALSVAVSTVPSLTDVNWRHRYHIPPDTRLAKEESIRNKYSEHNRGTSVSSNVPLVVEPPVTENRVPLERQISQQLRRASTLSEDSVGDEIYEGFESRYHPMTNTHGHFVQRPLDFDTDSDDLNSNDSESTVRTSAADATARNAQPTPEFYNNAAIDPEWVSSRQNVRVPIPQPQIPDIPPRSPRRPSPTPLTSTNHPVSHSPHTSKDDWETINESISEDVPRGVGQTGSSIGDTSDGFSISRVSEDGFGSTERIAQHPAPMAGHTNYRVRDLTSGKSPVLLPVSDQYKVNGYPANSLRLRPAPPVYQDPIPLRRQHNNPFMSSPPEIFSPTQNMANQTKNFKAKSRNQFPPTASTITTDGSGTTSRRADSHKKRNPLDRETRLSMTQEWMAAASDLGRSTVQSLTTGTHKRLTSWGLISAHANGEHVPGYIIRDNQFVLDGNMLDGVAGEESESVTPGGGNSVQARAPRQIRPRGETPIGDFQYRSPLAPPKAEASRELYSENRLIELEDLARSNQAQHGRVVSTASEGPSQRHIYETPVLNAFLPAAIHPLHERTWNIAVLAVSCFIPPLLMAFAFGSLDRMLDWKTGGRLQKFKRYYKRWAMVTLLLEAIVVIVVVAVTTAVNASRGEGIDGNS